MTARISRPVTAGVVLAIISLFTWHGGLSGPFFLDDYSVIAPLLERAASDTLNVDALFSVSGLLRRPIAMLSFALNANFSPGVFGFKLTNLLCHICTGIALYALSRKLLSTVAARHTELMAFGIAAAWLLHPLQVSTVFYSVQRMALLSALFCVLGMWCYISVRQRFAENRHGIAWLLACFLWCWPLAVLSKENGILLPFYLVALEWTVLVHLPRPRWLRTLLSGVCVLIVLAGCIYLMLNIDTRLLNAYQTREFTLFQRLLTQPGVVLTYLRWLLIPNRLDYGFYHDDYPFVSGSGDSLAAVVPLAILSLLAAGAWKLRQAFPLTAFGVAVFFVGHSLESGIFALELVFEHRNYLPSAGLLIALFSLLSRVGEHKHVFALIVLSTTVLGALTLSRASLWGEPQALYTAWTQQHPQSVRARGTLAEWYVSQGEYEAAQKLLAGQTDLTLALLRLRVSCLRRGEPGGEADEILGAIRAEVNLDYFAANTLLALTGAALDKRCKIALPTLLASVESAMHRRRNRYSRARFFLYAALLQHRLGYTTIAIERARVAANLDQSDPFVHYLLGEWYVDSNNLDAALGALQAARERHGQKRYVGLDAAVERMIKRRP